MTRVYLILAFVAAALIGSTVYTVYIFHQGGKAQEAAQAVAQVKHDKKVKRDYDKIDQQTPYGGNPAAVSAFLRAHTRIGQ